MTLETLADRLGSCPGCDLPAPVGEPCPERGCRQRGLHAIPAELAMDLGQEREPNLGRVLDGHLVIGLLGAGGFGRVYRALALAPHDYEGDEVALKIASPAGGQHDALAAERLGREARALGRLDHPNVVRLLGSGVADGAPYLVMELIADGVSLEDEIAARAARAEPFAPGEVRQILGQILDGLGAAHALGIVHRDVKPENVMLVPPAPGESGPQVRLLDFGLVKFRVKPGRQAGSPRSAAAGGAEEEADMGATRAERGHHHRGAEKTRSLALGTPTHMAPEQIAGRDIGPWTDLYAVGVIAFELVTGGLPFDGSTASAVLRERADPAYDALARAPALPAGCTELLTRALARDPAERYRSASAMRAALDEAMAEWLGPMATPRSRPRMPTSQRATAIELVADEAPPEAPSRLPDLWLRPLLPAAAMLLVSVLTLASGGRSEAERMPIAELSQAEVVTAIQLARVREPPRPEPPPVATPSDDEVARAARAALLAKVARCEATPAELAGLADACRPELGCELVPAGAPAQDLTRGLTLEGGGGGSVVLALGPATGPAADRCDARFQRSRAIIGGAWDEVDPAWGGYVQPRVVLEARRGNDVRARVVLAERAQSRSALATAQAALAPGVALCLPASGLGAGPVVLKTFEERLFQVADTGKVTAEEGRSPCRLDLAAVYRVGR